MKNGWKSNYIYVQTLQLFASLSAANTHLLVPKVIISISNDLTIVATQDKGQ